MTFPIVNLNGTLLPAAEARLPVGDQGLLYGLGLFETVRAYSGVFFRLEAHLARLRGAAPRLGIDLPWDDTELAAALAATLRANERADAVARLTVTAGEGGTLPASGGSPCFFIHLREAPGLYPPGVSAIVAGARLNSRDPLAGVKSLNFARYLLARREAAARGAGEAVLLNERDELVEASLANLFLAHGGRLFTPPLAAGCLPGITRAAVLEIAPTLSIPAAEVKLTLADLESADEAFLTSSGIEILPLTHLEAHPIGPGVPGPLTRSLAEGYRALVRRETTHEPGAHGGP